MEEAMMSRTFKRQTPIMTACILVFTTLYSFGVARADQSTSYMNASYAGNAYLNSTKSLEFDITPLANGSDTNRHFNWNWSDTNLPRYGGAQVGIDYFNSGTAHNFVLFIDNATDIQTLSGVGNNVSCERRTPIEHLGKTYFQGVCYSKYTVAPGHTFRIKVFNDKALGPSWFKATFDDLVSGAHLEIGSINVGDRNFQQPLRYTQFIMTELSNSSSCSSVGVNDTIISSLRNSETVLSNFSSQSFGSCINGVISPNKNSLGGQVFKFGGSNPAARNLEANVASLAPSKEPATKKPDSGKMAFSLVNFVDNRININVDLGSNSVPDKVYLIAPKLGVIDSAKLQGQIVGNIASWSLNVSDVLSGTSIPLKVISLKNGVESEALEGIFEAPSSVSKLILSKSVPLPAKKIKSRIIGTSAFISAESTIKAGAIATAAYIFGSSIGVAKSNAIAGDIVGSKILLEIPIKQSMAGKKLVVNLFLANDAGESQPSQVIIDVPSIPGASFALPAKPKVPNTVFCTKGSISRTFAATSCPPGWKK
jgi:hypothetical protein